MDIPDFSDIRGSATSWALWKVLDHAVLRYLYGLWPGAGSNGDRPYHAVILDRLTSSESFAQACRQLKNPQSAVFQALITIWKYRDSPE